MTGAVFFLGGAGNRLLPARVPFRFFWAAAIYQVLLWPVLWHAAASVPGFSGGTGPTLAAIHLLTLGVLATTAMGAALQLLPVATRQPIARTWPADLCFWLTVPGTGVLAIGMYGGSSGWLIAGAVAAGAGLLVFAVLMIDNLRRAGALPVVAGHGWAAVCAAAGLMILGIVLVLNYRLGFLADHAGVAAAHMVLGVFGFMGLLTFGFSQVLVPMFTLCRALPARLGWIELVLATAAVVTGAGGFVTANTVAVGAAIALGLGATGVYFWLMRRAMVTRTRRRLGPSFILVRISWGALGLGLLVGATAWAGAWVPNAPALVGVLILVGWLLTFLLGVLQRIVPFLATMHVAGQGGKPPRLSELTAEVPLRVHGGLHVVATTFLAGGVAADLPGLIRIGALAGLSGAAAFIWFMAHATRRLGAGG